MLTRLVLPLSALLAGFVTLSAAAQFNPGGKPMRTQTRESCEQSLEVPNASKDQIKTHCGCIDNYVFSRLEPKQKTLYEAPVGSVTMTQAEIAGLMQNMQRLQSEAMTACKVPTG